MYPKLKFEFEFYFPLLQDYHLETLCQDGSCYTFLYTKTKYEEAKTLCSGLEGEHRLAEPKTITSIALLKTLAGSGSLASQVWWMGIGKGDDRVWRYNSDQSEVPEQPSGGSTENCFTIMGMTEGTENCEEELASPLCENMDSWDQLFPGRLKGGKVTDIYYILFSPQQLEVHLYTKITKNIIQAKVLMEDCPQTMALSS